MPHQTHVRLDMCNALGQQIQRVPEAPYPSGMHHVFFNTSTLTSGLYFYRLTAQDQSMSRRTAILK